MLLPFVRGTINREPAAIPEKEKTTVDHIPIIDMTGQRCLDAGMDDYICKPIRSQELYDIVERFAPAARNPKDDLAPLLLGNE
jgi:CheY-like chemotaxis protein